MTDKGPLIELTVPMRTLHAGIGDRVRVSGDLARYLCANGHAVMIADRFARAPR